MRTLTAVVVIAVTGALSIMGAAAAFADSPAITPEPLATVAPIPQPGPGQRLDQWVDGSTYVFPCGTPTPEIINVVTTDWEITQWIQGKEYAVNEGRHITVTTTDNAHWPVGVTCGTADTSGAPPAGLPSTFSPLWVGPIPSPASVTVVPYTAAPAPAPASAAPVAPTSAPAAAAVSQPPVAPQTAVIAPAPAVAPIITPAIPNALISVWARMQHRIF